MIEKHGYDKDEVLFVGDSLKDGEIAGAVGVHFRGVERLFSSKDFRGRGLDSVRDLRELTALLLRDEARR